ncbi:hypothetical protein OPQ81_001038 [Rhizoctonia solani]|nr:hypothetical protein OPQ81_001038 [Rhizoctonia solani]
MEPWNASLKRHPKSTNLSRFRPNLPALTTTHGKPLAASVLNARCEISSSRCAAPIRFHMGSGNVCLALTGMAGYKNRSPALDYLILNQPMAPFANFPVLHSFEPGLASVAFHGAVDEARRLIFVGDNDRIKSYEWGNPSEVYEELLPVHTMETEDSEGPMTVLPNGSIVRAGKGGASVWDTVTLPAHGPDGDEIIGEEIEDFDTMRDDSTKSAFAVECSRVINSGNPSPERSGEVRRKTFQGPRRSPGLPIDPKRWVLVLENPTKLVTEVDEIEPSSGSPPTLHIKFLNQPNLKPSLWQPPLTAPLIVVCIKCAHEKGNYSCITIDLETGKSTSYYLGYGANVSAFSVTSANPQLFLTACNDRFACLFDIRHPLPILTFDSCGTSEFCKAAALAHPDSIPSELSHP